MNDIATSKFGHGGLQYTLSDGDLQPLGKRILVSKMQFGEKKTIRILISNIRKFMT